MNYTYARMLDTSADIRSAIRRECARVYVVVITHYLHMALMRADYTFWDAGHSEQAGEDIAFKGFERVLDVKKSVLYAVLSRRLPSVRSTYFSAYECVGVVSVDDVIVVRWQPEESSAVYRTILHFTDNLLSRVSKAMTQ